MALKTETDTLEMAERVLDAATAVLHPQHDMEDLCAPFEHGQHWIICLACGAQWSVVDAVGGESVDGFDFERVSEGDGSCEEG